MSSPTLEQSLGGNPSFGSNPEEEDLSVEEQDLKIALLLDRISQNAGVKGRKPDVVRNIEELGERCSKFGLLPDALETALDVVLSKKLDDTTAKKLVKLLLPRAHVPEDCAIKIMGCLGRYSRGVEAVLLRWLIIVYDYLDGRTKFVKLYGVAFHYLSYETLRLDIQTSVGRELPLTGLLHVYKSYFPDLILMPLPLSNRAIFKCPNQALASKIMDIRAQWKTSSALALSVEANLTGSKKPLVKIGSAKRQKLAHSTIPDAFTLYRKGQDTKNMPLAQITSLSSLVKHIDTLALPDQLSSILSNRLLQHVFCLQPSSSLISRIGYWLGQELVDLWFWGEKTAASRERFGNVLQKIVEVTVLIKDLFPVVETFLMPFLRMWNGREHQKEIFTLLSYLRPRSFEELYAFFLKPLQRIFYNSGSTWKGALLLCYRRLLQRWAQINWRGHLSPDRGYVISPKDYKSMQGLFTKLSLNVDYMKTMQEFIMHVDRMATVAFEEDENNVAVQHGVLSFLDLASSLPIKFRVPMAVIIPDSTIVYRCFLADSGMAMSRICGIILQFKNAFESFETEQQNYQALLLEYEHNQQEQVQRDQSGSGESSNSLPPLPPPPPNNVPGYSRDYVTFFNSFVMDICNFLWRSRAFNKTDKNARGFQVDS
ncbi:hypothetical protein DFQ27_003256 [Actinomortierella ambigua]|uniref:Mis6-domain-containing protein n=1 Tax=Actinomortierella ambigua TaxID=1343610 RepID=A0A9P6U6A0_9FUNG|nr:hypothetical protein DFQ27_003256 [Actinomortierella ambigua]